MKVELIQEEEDEKDINYPCLMQFKDEEETFIVFFISESVGFVVGECKSYCNGFYASRWRMSDFIPYKGKVVLEND